MASFQSLDATVHKNIISTHSSIQYLLSQINPNCTINFFLETLYLCNGGRILTVVRAHLPVCVAVVVLGSCCRVRTQEVGVVMPTLLHGCLDTTVVNNIAAKHCLYLIIKKELLNTSLWQLCLYFVDKHKFIMMIPKCDSCFQKVSQYLNTIKTCKQCYMK